MDHRSTLAEPAATGQAPTTVDGEMSARVAAFDWSRTPLGPMAGWPQSLRTVVGICLNSRFPMMIWWGPDLTNLYNDAYAPILGQLHPAALGRSGRDVWSDVWPMLAPQVESVMGQGRSTWNERIHLVVERNGFPEDAWFTWSYSPIYDERGAVGGLLNTCREDTAQVLAERERDRLSEQQRRADERARVILESISDAFFAVDGDWRFSYVNPQGERMLGRDPGDLIGKVIWEEYSGLRGTEFERVYRRAADERITASVTAYYPDHGRWYEVHVYPAVAGGISVYFRDVSERNQAEEAVRQSEQRLAAVVRTSLDCIVGMDQEGRVTEWNPAAEVTFGYTKDETMGREMASLIIPPALRDHHRQGLARYLVTGEGPVLGKRLELTAVRKDGTEFPVELSITRVNTEGPPAFTGYLRDITPIKNAERQREQSLAFERTARVEAERVSRMKDEFLSTLSHELRTPLNAILGWSQIIRQGRNAPADMAQGIEVIERNARAQSQIIEDLLDMSRIISGKVRLDVQRLDLSAIVRASIETALPAANAKGVRLKSVIDPLHGAVVSGDANRLQQVLWNLLSNAVKFTPKGGRVQVLLERVNSHLEISVIDTGEGIKPEFLPYVFDRFRQADASTTRRHGGLGLGLSIVKQLVELHGGSVRIKSNGPGEGATAVVALPLTVVHEEREQAPEPERRHPRLASTLEGFPDLCADVEGVRALVVDDEADARALVQRLLEDCKAIVTTASSADEAVNLLKNGTFDVLVSDIGMPDKDGYALIKRVRSLDGDKNGRIPAVALTAYARAEDRVRAIAAGFQMHVAKPVERVELITMVSSAAGRAGRSSA